MNQAFQTQPKHAHLCFAIPHARCQAVFAHPNTGFDTNSCHLVQFASKGRIICIIRMAKKRGERRCFKVPEFDSSESLLAMSVPACVGTFVLRKIKTGKDAGRQSRRRRD